MLLLSLFDLQTKLAYLVFIRHGQAENNTKRVLAGRTGGIPLTDAGKSQAAQAAELLAQLGASAIYSSPVMRARDTAEILADRASLNVTVDDRLTELDMGCFTGMKYDDVFSAHGNVFLRFYQGDDDISRHGVEAFARVRSRVADMARHASREHPGQNVALVTHMDPIKAALSLAAGPSAQALFELVIANASINVFGYADSKLSLHAINLMHPSRFAASW